MADPDDDVIISDAPLLAEGDDDKDWKAEFEGQRKVNRDLERKLKAYRPLGDPDDLKTKLAAADKPKPGEEVDADKLRAEAKAEARSEALKERVLDKIEAKAAKLFADPEDAVALLGRRADEFIDDGKLDTDAIQEALDELLKKKPHLAAAQGSPKRFSGTGDGGARNGSGRPAQLTEQDLKRMTPEAIVKARADGRLDDLMGVT